jgi:hypothetical protein
MVRGNSGPALPVAPAGGGLTNGEIVTESSGDRVPGPGKVTIRGRSNISGGGGRVPSGGKANAGNAYAMTKGQAARITRLNIAGIRTNPRRAAGAHHTCAT